MMGLRLFGCENVSSSGKANVPSCYMRQHKGIERRPAVAYRELIARFAHISDEIAQQAPNERMPMLSEYRYDSGAMDLVNG